MNALRVYPVAAEDVAPPRRSLRIAVVTDTYPPEVNGVAMTIGRLVSALLARDHHIQLIRPRQGKRDAAEREANLEQVLKPGIPIPRYGNLRMGLPAKFSLIKLWREKRPNIVHLVTEGPLGWSALSAALKLDIPVTSDFHTNFHAYSGHYGFGWLKTPIESYLRNFHNRTRLTMVPTQAMRDELGKDGFRDLEVVARGVDTDLFHPQRRSGELRASWGVGPQDLVALYVGRLAPEKNLPLVLRAFKGMRARHQSAKLVLVGDGPMRGELERAYPQAVFAGMRAGTDLATHYASGDVFLFPSVTETFGNVVLEAMASGLAVVAYDYAAGHELITHGEDGLLASFNAAEEFCERAIRLSDPAHVVALGHAARRTASRHDWTAIFDQFEQTLHQVVNEQERSAYVSGIELGSRPA